jgi:EAL domain-containing protein (putative c-di-GMP-specific phosphodiesterase class I)
MHVNLAARQLDDQGFVDALTQLLDDAPVAPGALCLEVTEATLSRDVDRSAETLGRVRDLGVGVAVDDFGTGPSSLSLLRRFPVSQLKIDRAVISELGAVPGEGGSGVVEALVDLGHVLGLDVVAEGVERDEELAALRSLGCDQAQGFVVSRPLPAAAIDELLVSGAL